MTEQPLPIQAIPISEFWFVDYHQWFDVPSSPESIQQHPQAFKPTLLHCSHPLRGRVLNLGWYPEADPEGQWRLVVHIDNLQGECLLTLATADKHELMLSLSNAFAAVTEGRL